MPNASDDESRRYPREPYVGSISHADLQAAQKKAAADARKDMILDQVVKHQEQTSIQLAENAKMFTQIEKDLTEGRGIMNVIKQQAVQAIESAKAATIAAQASTNSANENTKAFLEHISKHPDTTRVHTALDRNGSSWWKPIIINVLSTVATAAALGGLWASFAMKSGS